MRRFTTFAFLLLAALLVSLPALAQDVITTAIGGGPNGIPAIDANLYNPLRRCRGSCGQLLTSHPSTRTACSK